MVSILKAPGLGSVLTELKNQVNQIKKDISEIDKSFSPMPEMIESTNILRENEFLRKMDSKKTELIDSYEHYSNQIENLLSLVFDIQNELKKILEAQSQLMKPKKSRKKSSAKAKTIRKKTRSKSRKKSRVRKR